MNYSNEKIKKYYSDKENYDWVKASDTFIGPETILHRAREKEMKKLIKLYGGKKFADIGCGTGLMLRHLPAGSIGIDLNPRNLEKAAKYCPDAKLILGDIEERLPIETCTVDTVICTEVLEHLLYPEKTISEIRRVLSPNGRFIGSVPGKSMLWKLRSLSFSSKHFTEEPFHIHRNKPEILKMFDPYFEVVKLYPKMFRMNWYFVLKHKKL